MHLINNKELGVIFGRAPSWDAVMTIERDCAVVRKAVKYNTARFTTNVLRPENLAYMKESCVLIYICML